MVVFSITRLSKSGAKAYKPGLGKIEAFARHLGNPHASFPSVHVAGTNGKGSTSHMIAAALQAMGFKVGIYIPHRIYSIFQNVFALTTRLFLKILLLILLFVTKTILLLSNCPF